MEARQQSLKAISGLIVAVLALVLLSFNMSGYQLRFATTIFMYIALAQAWNIIGGYAGYISLGLVGFVGLGGYLTGIFMTRSGLPYLTAVILAGLGSGVLAGIIGVPILRLKAGYFAIATYAVAQVLRELTNNLTDLTGGGMGLSLPLATGSIAQINRHFYYLMLGLACLGICLVYYLNRAPLGYGLRAIKEDEEAAGVLGINTTAYKVIAFVLSSFLAAIIGGTYAYWLTFIEPISMFDPVMSITTIIMVMMGGAGTVFGPVLGGICISFLSEYLWTKFLAAHLGTLGLALILVVLFIPKGLIDLFKPSSSGRRSFRSVLATMKANAVRYKA